MSLPTLMLLPGMDGTGMLFDPLRAELGNAVGTTVVRYPTHGPIGYDELASIARAALPSGPFVVLGESFSGPIAILLAASRPAGLVGLVLACSFARNPRPALAVLARAALPIRRGCCRAPWSNRCCSDRGRAPGCLACCRRRCRESTARCWRRACDPWRVST
jgi:pimeloyl-ACP methyl ester carboxylesterase